MKQQPLILPVPATGTEDVLVDPSGLVWTGTEDGSIWRMRPDGGRIARVGNTGGRPLGLEWLPDDRVLVADAYEGLLAMDRDGRIERLVDSVDGRRMLFCNNAAVAANGDLWFTDSSQEHTIAEWRDAFLQNHRSGRLMCRRADGVVEVHLEGLAFGNGVALAPDESFVAVAETGACTVVRLWLTGERAGQRDLLCDDLPGYPDNIALGSDGLVWVTITTPRERLFEVVKERAPMAVRRAATTIPQNLQPQPRRYAWVQAYDLDGRLVYDVSAEASQFRMVTGVREHDGRVWLGSLLEPALAVVRPE